MKPSLSAEPGEREGPLKQWSPPRHSRDMVEFLERVRKEVMFCSQESWLLIPALLLTERKASGNHFGPLGLRLSIVKR